MRRLDDRPIARSGVMPITNTPARYTRVRTGERLCRAVELAAAGIEVQRVIDLNLSMVD